MLNWENIRKDLNEGTNEGLNINENLSYEIAQKEAQIAEAEQTLFTLQDLMRQAQVHKERLEREYDILKAQQDKKKSIVDAISKIFKTEHAVDTSVETINNTGSAMDFSYELSSVMNKLRYDLRRGIISEEEYKKLLDELMGQVSNERNRIDNE